MHQLPTAHYNRVRRFFPPGTVGRSFALAMVEGNHAGRVFVDDPNTPRAALIAPACDFNLVAGNPGDARTNSDIATLLSRDLPDSDGYTLVFPTSPAWADVLEARFSEAPLLDHPTRSVYRLDRERFAEYHSGWRNRMDRDYRVVPYDRTAAQGRGLPAFWGSADAFLARGIGFAAAKHDVIVSRCHSVLIGDGQAEISIDTNETHRRRGLATAVACAFIETCLDRDLEPAWSCWSENVPSRHLAESLGFILAHETPGLVIKVGQEKVLHPD